jgi:hypothetical protein
MRKTYTVVLALALLTSAVSIAAEEAAQTPDGRAQEEGVAIGIQIPPTGPGEMGVHGPRSGFDSPTWQGPGSDLLITPNRGRFGARVGASQRLTPPGYPEDGNLMMNPSSRAPNLNGLSGFFSSATGGIGFRIGYDRRLSPVVRLMAGTELLTYGYRQSTDKLGEQMPAGVDRITLISFPVGLQRQFAADATIVPHIGFGVGPILRFDHQIGPISSYPGVGFNAGIGNAYQGRGRAGGMDLTVALPIDDFPQLSLTVGGFAAAGFDILLGEDKDYAVTVDGRYNLAHFTETLGNPGSFSGPSLAIGFGKYF